MSQTYQLVNLKTGQHLWIGQSPNNKPDQFYIYTDPVSLGEDAIAAFLIESYKTGATLKLVEHVEETPEEGFYEVEWNRDLKRFEVAKDELQDYPECFEMVGDCWVLKEEYRLKS